MFAWLSNKMKQASARQCLVNVRIVTRTLVSVSNDAYARIVASGGETNPADIQRVYATQENLLRDIGLGIANGVTLDQIESAISEVTAGEQISDGAQKAIDHVLATTKKQLSQDS